jgi:hypothetical protein
MNRRSGEEPARQNPNGNLALLKNKFSSYLCFLSHKQHRSIKLWSGWLALTAGSQSHEHQPLIPSCHLGGQTSIHNEITKDGLRQCSFLITTMLFPDHDSAVFWSRQCCFLITSTTVLFLDHDRAVSWSRQCCFQITKVCFLIKTVVQFPDHESLFPDQESSALSWSRKCRLLILFSDHCNSVSRTRRCYFRVKEEVLSDHFFPITASSYICYCFSRHWPIFRLPTAVRFAAFSNGQPDGGVSRADKEKSQVLDRVHSSLKYGKFNI